MVLVWVTEMYGRDFGNYPYQGKSRYTVGEYLMALSRVGAYYSIAILVIMQIVLCVRQGWKI
jgi:hypothetical protein